MKRCEFCRKKLPEHPLDAQVHWSVCEAENRAKKEKEKNAASHDG